MIAGAVGAVLAGGRSKRFGAEKAVAVLAGRSLLEHAVAHLAPHAREVAVNAPAGSGAAALAERLGLPLAADAAGDPQGPLAGVKAVLKWALTRRAEIVLTAPCDTPLLPDNVYSGLVGALGTAQTAVAETPDGLHPICAAWRTSALEALEATLSGGVHPPVRDFLALLDTRRVRFEDAAVFANINTLEDLARAEAWFEGGSLNPQEGGIVP